MKKETGKGNILDYIKKHKSIAITNLMMSFFIIAMIGYVNYDKQITKQEVMAEVKKEALEDKQVTTLAISSVDQNKYATVAEVQAIMLSMYPVGSVYISTNNTNPNQFIGGSWERYGNGKTLVGVNESETEFASANKIGGEKNHVLTRDEMPQHEGHFSYWLANSQVSDINANYGYFIDAIAMINAGYMRSYSSRAWGVVANNEMIPKSYSIGGGQMHNNLQPYITSYIWKRTS